MVAFSTILPVDTISLPPQPCISILLPVILVQSVSDWESNNIAGAQTTFFTGYIKAISKWTVTVRCCIISSVLKECGQCTKSREK